MRKKNTKRRKNLISNAPKQEITVIKDPKHPEVDANQAGNSVCTGGNEEKVAADEEKEDIKNNLLGWLPPITITGLSFFVAVIAAAATIWQAWVAFDSERRQARAYVYVAPKFSLEIGKPPSFGVNVKSGGVTPAYDIRVSMRLNIRPRPGDSEPFLRPTGAAENTSNDAQIRDITDDTAGDFIFEEKSTSFVFPTHDNRALTQLALDELLIVKKVVIYISGRVSYMDVFDSAHYVDFCFFYPALDDRGYGVCDNANGTDRR